MKKLIKFKKKDLLKILCESISESIEEIQAFHGSRAKFDKFDLSFIGTGEGAQVHGYGIYVTVNKLLARKYAFGDKENLIQKVGKIFIDFPYSEYYDDFITSLENGGFNNSKFYLILFLKFNKHLKKLDIDRIIRNVYTSPDEQWVLYTQDKEGLIYTVEIPNDNGVNYFYKNDIEPISQITEQQRKMLISNADINLKSKFDTLLMQHKFSISEIQKTLYEYYNSYEKANEFLISCGFTGIHYFGTEDGECYLIYNPKDVKIIGKPESIYNPYNC